METNAVQTLIALGAATLSFSVFYIVAAVFWLKWKLEAHKATKTDTRLSGAPSARIARE